MMKMTMNLVFLISTLKYLFLTNKMILYVLLVSNVFFMVDISLNLMLDTNKMLFLFTVIFISINVFIFSKNYLGINNFMNSFFYIFLYSFIMFMLFFILNDNLFYMFIGWDGLGISSFFLIYYYHSDSCSSKSLITNMTNRVGDSFLLILLSISCMSKMNLSMNLNLLFFISCFMLILASITKSAQFPFISWLPFAMSAPTPISTLVHSSTLVTAGVFMLMKMFLQEESVNWNNMFITYKIMMLMSITTIFLSSLLSIYIVDIKKVIALSTMNHLGIMLLLISVGLSEMAMMHLLCHAYFKSTLFLSFGLMMISSNHSLNYKSIVYFNCFNSISFNMMKISIFSLNGLFFLTGFFTKEKLFYIGVDVMNIFMMKMMFWFILFLSFLYSFRLLFLLNNIHLNTNYFFSKMTLNKEMFLVIITQSTFSMFLGYIFSMKLYYLCFITNSLSFLSLLMIFLNVSFLYLVTLTTMNFLIKNTHTKMKFFMFKSFLLDFLFMQQISNNLNSLKFMMYTENGVMMKYLHYTYLLKNYWKILSVFFLFKQNYKLMLTTLMVFFIFSFFI